MWKGSSIWVNLSKMTLENHFGFLQHFSKSKLLLKLKSSNGDLFKYFFFIFSVFFLIYEVHYDNAELCFTSKLHLAGSHYKSFEYQRVKLNGVECFKPGQRCCFTIHFRDNWKIPGNRLESARCCKQLKKTQQQQQEKTTESLNSDIFVCSDLISWK